MSNCLRKANLGIFFDLRFFFYTQTQWNHFFFCAAFMRSRGLGCERSQRRGLNERQVFVVIANRETEYHGKFLGAVWQQSLMKDKRSSERERECVCMRERERECWAMILFSCKTVSLVKPASVCVCWCGGFGWVIKGKKIEKTGIVVERWEKKRKETKKKKSDFDF